MGTRVTRTEQTIMHDLDRRILQALQNDFRVENRPYKTTPWNLGIPHDELGGGRDD
ncbi:MAG: hypothetical protein ACYSUC_08290 [Planctomycetota bacterium]